MRLDHIPKIEPDVFDVALRDLQIGVDVPDHQFLQYLTDNPRHHGLLEIIKRFINILASYDSISVDDAYRIMIGSIMAVVKSIDAQLDIDSM